ncbi:DUF3558 family protein [Micromonospora musae]|nr:DUF3558 family protein [Micromonospora musae]
MTEPPAGRSPEHRPEPRSSRRRAALPMVTLALGLLLAGCSGSSSDPDAPPAEPTPAGSSSAAAAPADAKEAPVDACALLTDAEVTAVLGRHEGGRPGEGSCVWENPESYHSVTVEIGEPGTAATGRLPTPDPAFGEPEPGPDGIRFVRGNGAEFVVDDRYCHLVVVTSVTDDRDRPTLIRLVGAVRDRL